MAEAGRAIVGPIPEGADPDVYDRQRRQVLWHLTTGLYVIGSRHGERLNLMTANWVTQVSNDPKCVAVGVESTALTAQLIAGGKGFSISVLDRSDRDLVRKFVKPAVDIDLASVPATVNAVAISVLASGRPALDSAVAVIDCGLHSTIGLGSHQLFIGEVTWVSGDPDGTEVLRMEDTRMHYGG